MPGIWEVILTGGDPFMLSPRRIAEVTTRLGAIDHVKVLRWHTRVPAVDPARVTPELVSALKSAGKTVYVALHANHPRELTDGGARSLRPHRRCRHPHAEPDRAAQGRQRRRRDAGPPHARVRGGARQALLPAPPRPGARHRPLPHHHRRGPGPDAGAARAPVGDRAADLRARHPRRPRQGADRAGVFGGGRHDRRSSGRAEHGSTLASAPGRCDEAVARSG